MKLARYFLLVITLTTGCSMQSKDQKTNRLINATSPYLLQHANNPVDWYEWGPEALEKAKKEDKPVLVSIGYSSCHWCHVMEHESFENEDIAAIMNEHFVSIKVDREERPDIDQIYMEAVQAMGINGGWPLNVFITPDQKPFYGGTYFPPQNWSQLLLQISKVYREKRSEVNDSADDLARRLASSDLDRYRQKSNTEFTDKGIAKMVDALQSKFDKKWGGMDKAPKFVMPTQWQFLLRNYTKVNDKNSLDMVELTLKKMAMGGLYDQVGGGFARYSVDGEWFAPHFEKMLYDNAQLLSLYAEAFSITGDPFYKRIVFETIEWLGREMTNKDGGFYSALDADSEGEEGKFYVWRKQEWDSVLNESPAWLAQYYNITDEGNWEHGNNIMSMADYDHDFARRIGIDEKELRQELESAKKLLLKARDQRIRPGLDDKVLTGWNAMTIQGLVDAYVAFGEPTFLQMAVANMEFLEAHLIEDEVYRSHKVKRSNTEGFLEDYSYLIGAYVSLYQATFDENYLSKANHWLDYTNRNFFDDSEGYYHFSSNNSEQLIARKKEIFDNVIPSSNGVMARNLFHLGIILDREEWRNRAASMLLQISHLVEDEPSYMSHWAILYSEMNTEMAEIAIVGRNLDEANLALQGHYLPFALFMGTRTQSELPLLIDKVNPPDKDYTIYVCYNKTCKLPVHSVDEALAQLK
ncbi:MAG: thioredoxin domain-containing protein [Cyclobacteriaceae bacterium]